MHYMANWSGGKDSTASIILAHERNEPLDEIVFCEVMYDLKHEISGENPHHIKFIKETAKPVFERWGYKVTILRANRDYLDCFHRVIQKPTKHMDHKGKKYGFPGFGMCSVQRDLKVKPLDEYRKKITEPITQYIGIGIDEAKRLKSLKKVKGRISLLKKYGYTEEMARQKCIEYGLLSPCYELSKRGGCWFCPNAKLSEQKEIKKLYPQIWEQFVSLEDDQNLAFNRFHPFGPSLHEINDSLNWEAAQITLWDYYGLNHM